jgi:hypothetical protein
VSSPDIQGEPGQRAAERPEAPHPVALEALAWNSNAAGVGALLMIDAKLPRDQFGDPYQPLFWFDDQSRPLGLVVDEDGHVLAWESAGHDDPMTVDNLRCQGVPSVVERAALAGGRHNRAPDRWADRPTRCPTTSRTP